MECRFIILFYGELLTVLFSSNIIAATIKSFILTNVCIMQVMIDKYWNYRNVKFSSCVAWFFKEIESLSGLNMLLNSVHSFLEPLLL